MKYQFKAKDLKTGEWVTGDLAYANSMCFSKKECRWIIGKIKPMIVKHNIHGGMLYVTSRHFIDENTLELISNGTENQI
jgi:hypothetical protein